MKIRGQTSLEYMLQVGAVILFIAVVLIIARSNIFATTGQDVQNKSMDIQDVLSSIPPKKPVISNYAYTNPLGVVTVTWATDIPSTSYVEYSNSTTSSKLGNNNLVTAHSITLPKMALGLNFNSKLSSCVPSGDCATYSGTFTT